MTRLLLICVAASYVSGCATPAAPVASVQTVAAAEPREASNPASTETLTGIESIDPPAVAPTEITAVVPNPNERICRREMRTGSHRAVRVCMTRAEMERLEQESKDTFSDLHDSQRMQDQAEQIRRK